MAISYLSQLRFFVPLLFVQTVGELLVETKFRRGERSFEASEAIKKYVALGVKLEFG